MQNAVSPEPYAKRLFIRLEMQVGRASTDGIKQHLVDEAYNRGIVRSLAPFLSFAVSADRLYINPV